MKSNEDFERYYDGELKRAIDQLEEERTKIAEKYSFKRYRRNLKWLAIASVVLGIARAAVPTKVPEEVGAIVFLTILYAIIGAIYIFVRRSGAFKPLKKTYKESVIPKIISFLDGNLKHEADKGISVDEFNASKLFETPTRFESEDLVYGRIGSLDIRMSDVKSSKLKRYKNKNSGGSNSVAIFKGLFIISDLSQLHDGNLIIKPTHVLADAMGEMARSIFGNQLVDSIVDKLDLTTMATGDAEFDKMYNVKSKDADSVTSVLTPQLTQLILALQKEVDLPVSISLMDNRAYIAFSGVDLFEVDAHTSLSEKDISKQYFQFINMGIGIAEGIDRSTSG